MKRTSILLGILLSLFSAVWGQYEIPVFGKQNLVDGYAKAIEGEVIPYYSAYPEIAREALLTRCTDGKKVIRWESAEVPAGQGNADRFFVWIAGHAAGTAGGMRTYFLELNGAELLEMTVLPDENQEHWHRKGKKGVEAVFHRLKTDRHGDAHGLFFLKVPARLAPAGKPVQFSLRGKNQDSPDWFMTFKTSLNEPLKVEFMPFLHKGKRPFQSLRISGLNFSSAQKFTLQIDEQAALTFPLHAGFNQLETVVPAVTQTTERRIRLKKNGETVLDSVYLQAPVKYRELYLIHHSHLDIGYSHTQEQVKNLRPELIRKAISESERTRNRPKPDQFHWNIESTWAVEQFLAVADSGEKSRFFQAVQRGQLEVTALYANLLTGLCSPEELNWALHLTDQYRRKYKVPIQTAMISDVPGMQLNLLHALANHDIRYLSSGPNYQPHMPDGGDRIGTFLQENGDRPFWWVTGDQQDSVLVWVAGHGYSDFHKLDEGKDLKIMAPLQIRDYLQELDAKEYPYQMVQWRVNLRGDNGPVSTSISDFVADWNARYASPQLVLSNLTDMFQEFERRQTHNLPLVYGDLTPWWEDGAMSTAFEEGRARRLSARLAQLKKLSKVKETKLDSVTLYRAQQHILLFHEHTWGAWCSISQPDKPFTTHQWEIKKAYLDTAELAIEQLHHSLFPPTEQQNRLTVYNALPFPGKDLVRVSWPAGFKGNILRDEEGNAIPVQRTNDGKMVFVAEVPAQSSRSFFLDPAPVEVPPPVSIPISIEGNTGSIGSIEGVGRNWVDNSELNGLLLPLYVPGLNPEEAIPAALRSKLKTEKGPVLSQQITVCELPGTNGLALQMTAYQDLPWVDLEVGIEKKAIREKESIHIAFPFELSDPQLRIGREDVYFLAGEGQAAGSNHDFISAPEWLDLSGGEDGVTLVSLEGVLWEVGSMTDERKRNEGYRDWKKEYEASSTLFCYAMNNYWHTNYKADQSGLAKFRFRLWFHPGFNRRESAKMAQLYRCPLLGVWEE